MLVAQRQIHLAVPILGRVWARALWLVKVFEGSTVLHKVWFLHTVVDEFCGCDVEAVSASILFVLVISALALVALDVGVPGALQLCEVGSGETVEFQSLIGVFTVRN